MSYAEKVYTFLQVAAHKTTQDVFTMSLGQHLLRSGQREHFAFLLCLSHRGSPFFIKLPKTINYYTVCLV